MLIDKRHGQLTVQAGFSTDQGPRDRNEDYGAVCLEQPGRATGVIAAVADGVGGQAGGREAAELTVRGFLEAYLGSSESQSVRTVAARGLEAINRWIFAQGRMDARLLHMSSTFTGMVLRGRTAHLFHVGDSRAYRWRNGTLTQLTRDHVPERSAMRNQLTRAVGAEDSLRIDYRAELLEPRDRLCLCSDGVHGYLKEGRLAEILSSGGSAEEAARLLVEAAQQAGSADNSTALVLDVLSLPAISIGGVGEVLARLPLRPPPASGAMVDGFEIGRLLSDGRYSQVFRATDQETGRQVIIKFPKTSLLGSETNARAAFLREAWVASRVDSPFVGSTLEVPHDRRTSLYVVQPFYDGETLEARLLRKPAVGLEEGLAIAVRLAKAVTALHRAGVIHRDIKPDNIILTREGGLRLIDLGIARLPHLDLPASEIPGTPSYMAPELFEGSAADERSDLFALGVTLYRTFSAGPYPYGEIEPFSRPRSKSPTKLTQHRPDLPDWLDLLLARVIEIQPEQRVQDAIELAFEIETNAPRGAVIRRKDAGLYGRNPLLFWKLTAFALAITVLVLLARP